MTDPQKDPATPRGRELALLTGDISRAFVAARPDDLGGVVVEALRGVGRAFEVDVAFVMLVDELADEFTDGWEWTSWGGPGRPPQPGERLSDRWGAMLEGFHRGVPVRIRNLPGFELPESDRERFDEVRIRSALAVPVLRGDELVGVAGFLARDRTIDWTDGHVEAAAFYGDLIVSAVDRVRQRASQRLAQQRAARIAAHVGDALLFTDRRGIVTWASPSSASVLGYDLDRLRELYLPELATEPHTLQQMLADTFAGVASTGTIELRTSSGEVRWFELAASLAGDDGGPGDVPAEALLVVRDVHARQAQVIELAGLAETDALTGVLNRRGLRRALDDLGADDLPALVAFVDLDRFKAVNDRHGHVVGDEVLVEIAARLGAVTADAAAVARLGGDEFVLLFRRTGRTDADAVVDRIRGAVDRPVVVSGVTATVAASVGIAVMTSLEQRATVVSDADASMYRAKRGAAG